MEKISLSIIKMNNEQSLFENKININKLTNFVKPRILFRNDTLNNVINGSDNYHTENKNIENTKLTDNKKNYFNKYDIYNKHVLNFYNKSNKLKLPSLSEKIIKIDSLSNKKILINKRYEETFNNDNINSDSYRKKIIDSIMRGCCSVVKMNLPKKKKNNNKECLIWYQLNNKNFNRRLVFLYKNNIIKNKNKSHSSNAHKNLNIITSNSLYRKDGKYLVNEETMTHETKYINTDTNKNNDYDYDYMNIIPSILLNKNNSYKRISNYFHFKNYNDYKSNIFKNNNYD